MTAYIVDMSKPRPEGAHEWAAVFAGPDPDQVEAEVFAFMDKHEPRHYSTPNHARRYRVIYAD